MDDQKQSVLVAVLVFNIVVMLYMGYQYFLNTGPDDTFSFWNFPLAILLGGIAAGGTFFAVSKKS